MTNRRRASPMRGAFDDELIDRRPYTVEVVDAAPSGIATHCAPRFGHCRRGWMSFNFPGP